jgi:hypothetical protein
MPALAKRLGVVTVVAALACTACSGKNTQAGGLELLIATNLTTPTQFDSITLEVQQQTSDGQWGPALIDTNFLVPGETTLPTTFAIAAGTSSDQVVQIQLEALKGGQVVDLREVEVQVPTTRVAELTLLLAESCLGQVAVVGGEVQSTCPAGQSCQPATGTCGPDMVSGPLATYDGQEVMPDATVGAFLRDAGVDATVMLDATARDAARDTRVVPTGSPRLIAPLSGSSVTSQSPTLRWQIPDGATDAHVDICSDRACEHVATSFAAVGASIKTPKTLAPGVTFWRVVATFGDETRSSAVWEMFVGHRSAPVDTSWGTTLDVDGDGIADMAVGASGAEVDGGRLPGKVFVYAGSAHGLTSTPMQTLTDDNPIGAFGSHVTSIGDVNGDGFADLGVQTAQTVAAEDQNTYALAVYLGSATGLGTTPAVTLPMWVGATGVGDMNGDGYADIAVGHPGPDEVTDGGPYDGVVDVYFGGPKGLPKTASLELTLPPPNLTGGHVGGGSDGRWLVGSDFNGDGYGDLAVSGDGFSSARSGIAVFLGGPEPAKTAATNLTITTLPPLTLPATYFLGTGLTTVDVDGDGYPELVAGVATDTGMGLSDTSMMVFPGDASGRFVNAPLWFDEPSTDDGPAAGGSFGFTLANAGDLNGDGFEDLVVSDAEASNGAGRSYLYFGRSGAFAGMVSETLFLTPSTIYFGQLVVGLGDVTGDTFASVAVTDYEAVYVFHGGEGGVTSMPALTLALASDVYLSDVAGRE